MIKMSQLALIALGSNEKSEFGDARETVQKSMSLIAQLSDQAAQFSDFYKTPAFPEGSGPAFVNAAMVIITKLSARDLLAELHKIEATYGRKRTTRWGQRTLDVDLIAFGDQVIPNETTQKHWRNLPLNDQKRTVPTELILPHPRVQDRAFVLVPLADVAPDWQHPLLHQSVFQMCAALPAGERAEVIRIGTFTASTHSP